MSSDDDVPFSRIERTPLTDESLTSVPLDEDLEHRDDNDFGTDNENDEDNPPQAHESVLKDGFPMYLKRSLSALFLTKLNILLAFIPAAIICASVKWSNKEVGDAFSFLFALLALIPLAERLSFVTEDLANYTNDTIGGLMNASMGNVPELIMSIVALSQNQLLVVQRSLLGSVLSNILLVLGTAFLLGGIKHTTQTYNKTAAQSNATLLLLVVLALIMPAALNATEVLEHEDISGSSPDILTLSRTVSVFLLITYAGLIVYQMKTHTHLFEGEDDDEDEPPVLGIGGAIFWMALFAVIIAILSEIAISSIDAAAKTFNISEVFIASILLPIVGNAAEHASAVIFAMRNRMEISLGIAVGSSAQVSMFLIPVLVLIAWPMGKNLSLDFRVFEATCISISIVICSFIIQHGESDWLKGVVLLVSYFVAAVSFWFHVGDYSGIATSISTNHTSTMMPTTTLMT